ncbi:TMEM175 family protein [Streptomyces violaceusniger]|uniref:TMEM175 family protein n=1 Tax=Streptomyces violaceusniger TaxID=68280 RepID=UPI003812EAE1
MRDFGHRGPSPPVGEPARPAPLSATSLHGIDVERIRAFSDAVFAIAITLLALEITVPEDLPTAELGHALKEEALPSVAGYLLSFAVVGAPLWISHHRLFRMAKVVDGPLLHVDLALMALVAALPFPTKIVTEYHSSAIATSLYAGTITLRSGVLVAPGRSRPVLPRTAPHQEEQACGGRGAPPALVTTDGVNSVIYATS